MKAIEELIKELPPELQQEVSDFAQFLLDRKVRPKQKKLRMTWVGGCVSFATSLPLWNFRRRRLNGGGTDVPCGY